MYGALFSENFFLFIISYLIEILNKICRNKIPTFIKNSITLIYALKLYLVVKKIQHENSYCTTEIEFDFIFPTADPLAFRFMDFYYSRNIKSKFYFRTVGAETRGTIANENIFERLASRLESSDRIRIGYEVSGYRDYLIDNGIDLKYLYLVPPPLRFLQIGRAHV